jgi:hypothetical protein
MTEQNILWSQDGIDPGWFIAEGMGSVRSRESYRPGSWWFLAAWLPTPRSTISGHSEQRHAQLARRNV